MVYQNSTINALAEGLYEGDVTFGQLRLYGSFGLGTFNNLDGEMIGFDGAFYQVKSDGSIVEVADEQLTPFSVVTKFQSDQEIPLLVPIAYEAFQEVLTNNLPSRNYMYAFRVDGVFSDVVTRSVPVTPSGVRLVDVIPKQTNFEYKGRTRGTLVGFYFPSFMKDINVVGYHFHFLSDDKTKGGHVLDLVVEEGTVQINHNYEFGMILPEVEAFKELDLEKVEEHELNLIEKRQ